MATIPKQKILLPDRSEYAKSRVFEWPNMTTGDKGEPVSLTNFADRSVVGLGDFNGGTLAWEGFIGNPDDPAETDDDAFWHQLTDPSDNFLTMTAPKLEAVCQICLLIRPVVTGGTAPAINARLMVKE